LEPLEVDFMSGTSERKGQRRHEVANKVDKAVDAFNRVCYNNNVVFVHCAMGVSRSASCVIMYIMKKYKVLFDDVSPFDFFIHLGPRVCQRETHGGRPQRGLRETAERI
jgi:hypothetical protein